MFTSTGHDRRILDDPSNDGLKPTNKSGVLSTHRLPLLSVDDDCDVHARRSGPMDRLRVSTVLGLLRCLRERFDLLLFNDDGKLVLLRRRLVMTYLFLDFVENSRVDLSWSMISLELLDMPREATLLRSPGSPEEFKVSSFPRSHAG